MANSSKPKELGPKFSEGARLLWLELLKTKYSIREAEREWGMSRGLLHRLLYGHQRAGRVVALRLFGMFSIPVETWDRTPIREFVPPARSAA